MNLLKRPDLARHYEDVLDSLRRGRLIWFLGEGVNLLRRGVGQRWVAGKDLPSWGELAQHLASKHTYPTGGPAGEGLDLPAVAQYLFDTFGEARLYDELHDLFDREYIPTSVHAFLAQLPAVMQLAGCKRPHQLVVTTNYDDLMEKAFRACEPPEPYDLVYYDARSQSSSQGKFLHRPSGEETESHPVLDPQRYRLPLDLQSVVFKMHGAVARNRDSSEDSYVITTDHYSDYSSFSEIPITIRQEFQMRNFLFLGYSLSDWNLQMIFRRIWREQKLGRESWTINHEENPVQRLFWEKRNVRYIVASLEDYVHDLTLKLLFTEPSPVAAPWRRMLEIALTQESLDKEAPTTEPTRQLRPPEFQGGHHPAARAEETPTASTGGQVFISYSRKDGRWLSLVQKHLAPLERQCGLSYWSDQEIDPGGKWKDEIRSALSRARVSLLLVTPNFLASDFISKHELPPLLSGTKVFWLACSASSWEVTEIKHYQAANDPSRPMDGLTTGQRNKVLVEVGKQLVEALDKR
jgi:hypothetical protein